MHLRPQGHDASTFHRMAQVYAPLTSAMCIPCPEGLDCQMGADEVATQLRNGTREDVGPWCAPGGLKVLLFYALNSRHRVQTR